MQNDTQNIIGVDVGSGSVRAGIFNLRGELLAHATREITLFRSAGNKVEQSSREIWQAVCYCIKTAVASAGVSPSSIAGTGFDATCSLVVIGDNDAPLAVGPSDDADRNIIVWMDHRATGQAEKINATGHPVLRYVGGKISPEMQTPKILWLKENRPHIYQQARHFFDLADYLTWRSTGDEARSVCTVTCKWTYLAHEQRWDAGYFRQIGLDELADEDLQITLAVSLHAPNDGIRNTIMPVSKANPMDKLLEACGYYTDKTKRRITFEYSLIKGVNDSPQNAKELASKLKGMLCHVNLIPINDVKERDYVRSSNETIKTFEEILLSRGIETTVRRKLGSDIDAACGQLRKRYKDEIKSVKS